MTDNMTIGPALAIGGNKVEMTQQGKIQVTNPNGKIKTLSQDEFKKQLIKNADKINNGEDFEFKKDNKNLKIAGAAVATAAVITGVIYRKEIGKYIKDFSFSKLWDDIKGVGKKVKDKAVDLKDRLLGNKKPKTRTIFDNERTANATAQGIEGLEARLTSKETQSVKNSTIAKMAEADAKAFEQRAQKVKDSHKQIQEELNKALGLRKGQKDNVEVIPRNTLKPNCNE